MLLISFFLVFLTKLKFIPTIKYADFQKLSKTFVVFSSLSDERLNHLKTENDIIITVKLLRCLFGRLRDKITRHIAVRKAYNIHL